MLCLIRILNFRYIRCSSSSQWTQANTAVSCTLCFVFVIGATAAVWNHLHQLLGWDNSVINFSNLVLRIIKHEFNSLHFHMKNTSMSNCCLQSHSVLSNFSGLSHLKTNACVLQTFSACRPRLYFELDH